jgi:hypothetical protein
MHWTDRREAVANLGKCLQALGWTLYGWRDDESDSMTDYYSPESWDGIAEKNGYVAVVDVSNHPQGTLACSGGRKHYRRVQDGPCPRCKGSGEEPDGWTYARAKEDPVGFNTQRARKVSSGAVDLFPHVLSPHSFTDAGLERCIKCQGDGHIYRQEEYIEPWPVFHANPKNCLWHVEKDGKVLAKGIGLRQCLGHRPEELQGARALAAKIDAIAKKEAKGKPTPTSSPSTAKECSAVSIEKDRSWTWVRFAAKPTEEILAHLKELGGNWSHKRKAWYFTYEVDLSWLA